MLWRKFDSQGRPLGHGDGTLEFWVCLECREDPREVLLPGYLLEFSEAPTEVSREGCYGCGSEAPTARFRTWATPVWLDDE